MKAKSTNKLVSLALALFMLLMSIPFSMLATDVRAAEASEAAKEGTYVLESKSLTPFEKTKADGDKEKAGTDGYFTLIYSASSKVDSSSKKFSDNYESAQRINLGGKASTSKNSIMFTTSAPATVKIWWAEGGDDNRQMVILDSSGNEAASTKDTVKKNDPAPIASLQLKSAGTYYLGGKENNNYIFKVEVTEEAEAKTYDLSTEDLTAFDAGAKKDGDDEKAGTDGFFTIIYSAKSKVDTSSKTFSDGYKGTKRINFGAVAETAKNAIRFTTTGAATLKVWWAEGGDDNRQIVVLDSSGKEVAATKDTVKKNDPAPVANLELPNAGTYYVGSKIGNNYIFKVSVTVGAGKVERSDWTTVANPTVDKVEQTKDDDGKLKGKLKVTVKAVVGAKGGDIVDVTMYDKDGKEVEKVSSTASSDTHELEFSPKASGTYTFKAVLSREGEETKKETAEPGKGEFVLPLGKPSISSATSKGNGKVEVVWNAVDEATGYEVFVDGTSKGTTDKTTLTVEGLEIGKIFKITVKAIRGEEKGDASDEKSVKTTTEAQTTWGYTMYGPSVGEAKYDETDKTKPVSGDGIIGDLNMDGKITVFSLGGKGKVVNTGLDGLSFYYTAVPTTQNFTLKAKVHIDNWTYSNGQDGFGLVAIDSLPPYGEQYWTNQYMLAVSKMEYWWNDELGKATTNTDYTKYSNVLGVGVNTKLGVTKENADKVKDDSSLAAQIAPGTQYPLDFSAALDENELDAGTYNIVGNCTNKDKLDVNSKTIKELTDFVLEIQKNNTGYFLTYYDTDGKTIIGQKKFYDPKALSMVDADNVYVGFFAARNAQATFSDVEFTTIDASKDAAPEERPTEYVDPNITFGSTDTANAPSYKLLINSYSGGFEVPGTADIYVGGKLVKKGVKLDGTKTYVEVEVTLANGKNKIDVVFTPDANITLPAYTALSTKEAVTKSINVTYNTYFEKQNNLYVSPKGTKGGNGGTEYPLDIYTAISVVRPGQTIVLMEGTYELETQVLIKRGMDGTAKEPIKMIADPEAKTRPVFDFKDTKSGMKLGGNYWYLQGFDITNSGTKTPGLVVSGSNNTVDNINAYDNTDTGIYIKAYRDSSDPKDYWPKNNTILNCTSYNNADSGLTDADGFACKLTTGTGNVFDGCVAYNNADDGWDLYAKTSTGEIGAVTIRNCVAYKNGYLLDGTNAGDGNGFKMGGENLPGGHTIINSISFDNKADGITCNSCPDIKVKNCISFNNGSSNISLYSTAKETHFEIDGLISISYDSKPAAAANADVTTSGAAGEKDNIKPNGDQSKKDSDEYKKIYNDTYYEFNGSKTVNAADNTKELKPEEVFASLDASAIEKDGVKRAENGKIDLGNFLAIDETKAAASLGPDVAKALKEKYVTLDGDYETPSPSKDVEVTPDTELPPPTGFGVTIVVAVLAISAAVAIILIKKRKRN